MRQVVPVAALMEMIKEVDCELVHCRKQMAEHSAVLQAQKIEKELEGVVSASSNSVTPSESMSVMARKKKELESAAEVRIQWFCLCLCLHVSQ